MRRRRFSKKATNERREDFMRVLAMNVALACALVAGLIAPAEAQSSLKKLQRCLEFKDMTKPRLDCYDAIVPPQTKLKSLPAELVVNDCRFLKDDKKLICSTDLSTGRPSQWRQRQRLPCRMGAADFTFAAGGFTAPQSPAATRCTVIFG
jgi:hypothetical protein